MRAWLTNTRTVNAFRMTPRVMFDMIDRVTSGRRNSSSPTLRRSTNSRTFADDRGIEVRARMAVMTSAGTLYPFMRQKIDAFGCRVFNRYGSREAGDIACELPEFYGLWVAPVGHVY